MEGRTRPSTVEVMILVNIIGAISVLLFGWLVGPSALPMLGSSLGSSYELYLVIFIILIAISNIGLWFGQKWGLAATGIAIIVYFASFAMFVNALGLIIGFLMIYYATRPLVKDWTMTKPPNV